jgi:hypothetical protein
MWEERANDLARLCTEWCARGMTFRLFGRHCSKVIPLLRAFRGKD